MPALIERPKMSLAMWAALKSHIMKQREKKKQEQEADAAIERIRREQEMKRKQDAMTLEEIKEQRSQMDIKLSDLKEEKHELFMKLKKVLNEDETRRKAQVKETNEFLAVSHGCPQSLSLGAPPPLYMTANTHLLNRTPNMYKVGPPHHQTLLPAGSLKRQRSPSPPLPPTGYHQNYNYKTQISSAFSQKQASGGYSNAQPTSFYTHQTPSTGPMGAPSSGVVTVSAGAGASRTYPTFTSQYPSDGAPPAKHVAHPAYHLPHIQQQNYVNTLQQQLEQANQKSGFSEEKYYVQQNTVVPIRGVAPIPAGQSLIPIQQATKASGGITTGFPVRNQQPPPNSHFQQTPGSSAPQHGTVPRLTFQGPPTTRYY